jgi:hypothetical protein
MILNKRESMIQSFQKLVLLILHRTCTDPLDLYKLVLIIHLLSKKSIEDKGYGGVTYIIRWNISFSNS